MKIRISVSINYVMKMNTRVRDSSGKPADQWSDSGIDRGLV